MKKIIITGGLGYIGYELCKIYSGKSHNYNVIVIDNKFFSKRVNQLRNWNIEYINADILDKNLLKNTTKKAYKNPHILQRTTPSPNVPSCSKLLTSVMPCAD